MQISNTVTKTDEDIKLDSFYPKAKPVGKLFVELHLSEIKADKEKISDEHE